MGVPLTLWSKLKNKHELTEEDKAIIKETIKNALNELEGSITIANDIVDSRIYPTLLIDYGLRSHDAILLTTEIVEKCEWFVTNEMEIILLDKETKKGKKRRKGKPRISKLFRIVPDSPQNFLTVSKGE